MKTNMTVKRVPVKTHEGGKAASHQKPLQELERAVATCMLFENTFYESGNEIASRISELCGKVPIEKVAELAIKARTAYKLRHVPLFLCLQLVKLGRARTDGLVAKTIEAVIQRPDEMGELLSLYWKDAGKTADGNNAPLSAQLKKGLSMAFGKFTGYQFQKWDRDGEIKLRDVMFLVHPKAASSEQNVLFSKIANKTLDPADTWEVALSAGNDKKATWERLLANNQIGYTALLMNLRNMEEAFVDRTLVETALLAGAVKSKALPFRFIAAYKSAPSYAQSLSEAMLTSIAGAENLKGHTALVVDVSGSMDGALSGKSKMGRLDAASALAILLRQICDSCRVFTFSNSLVEVPNLRGIGLVDAISKSQDHSGTLLASSLRDLKKRLPNIDRLIAVTDEQSHDGNVVAWAKNSYIVNVAPYKPGLELDGGWVRINGWSERLVDWIRIAESETSE